MWTSFLRHHPDSGHVNDLVLVNVPLQEQQVETDSFHTLHNTHQDSAMKISESLDSEGPEGSVSLDSFRGKWVEMNAQQCFCLHWVIQSTLALQSYFFSNNLWGCIFLQRSAQIRIDAPEAYIGCATLYYLSIMYVTDYVMSFNSNCRILVAELNYRFTVFKYTNVFNYVFKYICF